jgi:enoyl-CoA hydratase/carnithine racemase
MSTPVSQQDEKVKLEHLSDHVFKFILNNPKTLNALDMDMIEQIWQKLVEWNHDPDNAPTVVMMRGSGDRAFCAGGDIKSIYDGGVNQINPNTPREFFAREYIMDYALTKMKPIQVSIWNGIVMGGGVGVSVHSPIRIATEKSVFAMPETGIGFFPDVGGSYFLSHIKGNPALGKFLGVSGYRLKSKDLLKWGVATNYIETSKLDKLYEDVAKNTSKTTTLEDIKQIVDAHSDNSVEGEPIPEETINYIFKPDSMLEIFKRLEEVAEGKQPRLSQDKAQKWLSAILRHSPISCCVVVEQIKRGRTMTLKDVFNMEYGISQAFMELGEFYEGVRALLIDKDNKPSWKHKTIGDVVAKDFEFFFDRKEKLDLDLDHYFKEGVKF